MPLLTRLSVVRFTICVVTAAFLSQDGHTNKARLPSLDSLAGEWVGVLTTGRVCRLLLDEYGRGSIRCSHHGRVSESTVQSVELHKFRIRLIVTPDDGGASERVEGVAGSMALDLKWHTGGTVTMTLFRGAQVLSDFRSATEPRSPVEARTQ